MFDLDGFGWFLLGGLFVTVALAAVSMLFACALGALGAWGRLSGSRLARRLTLGYTTLVRGVPDYILLLLVYFGGQVFVNRLRALFGAEGYLDIDPFLTGVLTLGLIFGTYMAETLRGAFLAIPPGQIEAARALGLSKARLARRILLPQLLFHALPACGNVWLVLVKTTAIVSLIGLNDMMRRATAAAGATQKPFKFYSVVSGGFLLITSVSHLLIKRAAERSGLGFRK